MIKLTCSLSSDRNKRIFLTASTRRERCPSVFGKTALAPSSSSLSFSGSYDSAKTDLRLVANLLTSGSGNFKRKEKLIKFWGEV